ncbi:hypothetical protein Bca101_059949 [Brassica carinata]
MAQKDRNTMIAQKAFEMVDKVYVIYQYSNESTTKGPVVSHPKSSSSKHIQYFGGTCPFIGRANRSERPKGQAISCDEATKIYGGVLIKEFCRYAG